MKLVLCVPLLGLVGGTQAQTDNVYWGSYDLTIPGGSGGGNAVELLTLPENAPSFFDFANFQGPRKPLPNPVLPQPAPVTTRQQVPVSPPIQAQPAVPQQIRPQPAIQQQVRPQPAAQQQLRVQPNLPQQFRQQPRPQPAIRQQFRPQPAAQQQLRVQPNPPQQFRQQTPQTQQRGQASQGFQVLSSKKIEFLPANSPETQEIRQQIASGQFNPNFNRAQQSPASVSRPSQALAQRTIQQPSTQEELARSSPLPNPQQVSSRFSSFQKVGSQPQQQQQLRVFAPNPQKQAAVPSVPTRTQPQSLAAALAPVSAPQSQPSRFSNFRQVNRQNSQRGHARPAPQPAAQRPAPQPAQVRPTQQVARSRQAPQPTHARPAPTPQQAPAGPLPNLAPEEEEVFNDYDSGAHRVNRFQLFQRRKKQKAAALAASLLEETKANKIDTEPVEKKKLVAVRRKRPLASSA